MIYKNRAQPQIALPHFSHLRLALSSLWENEYLYSNTPTAPSPARWAPDHQNPELLMNKYERIFSDFKDFLIKLELVGKKDNIGASKSMIQELEQNLNIRLDESMIYYLTFFGGNFRESLKTSNTDFLTPNIRTIYLAQSEAIKQKIFKDNETTVIKQIDSLIPMTLQSELKNVLFINWVSYSNSFEFIELNIENPRSYVIYESLNSPELNILSNGVRISFLPMHYFFISIYYYYKLDDKSMLQTKYIDKIPWLKAYKYLCKENELKNKILAWRIEYYLKLEELNEYPTIDQLEYGFINYLIKWKNLNSIFDIESFQKVRIHTEYLN